ncbi:uncharacterized protein EDB93DRAFT_678815 [Suillus bovinus]|uniref:uncharacterized protein n=1 Tax=Suillus bovinus TaxID=48563 RepID=UPI001B872793|nr:uncharacterized protein EDB93DRAFT_678815 [Suillus bovinus]KAG2140514.1 hypothetical protein EDB93DRAFT_678815 [Suillus bovinus]
MPKIPKVKIPKIPNALNMPSMPNMPSVPKVLSDKITSPSIPGFFPKPRASSPFSPGPSASPDPGPDSHGPSPKPLSGSSWNSGEFFESSWSLPGIPIGFSPRSPYPLGKVADAASRSAQSVSGSVSKATGPPLSPPLMPPSRSAQNISDSVHALQDMTLDLAEAIQQTVIASCMWVASTALQTFALRVAEHEDVNMVDGYERHRRGIEIEGTYCIQVVMRNEAWDNTVQEETKELKVEKDLPVISPVIDGRLKDLDGKAGKV